MSDDTQYQKFLTKLRQQGLTDDQIKQMLTSLTEMTGTLTYMALMTELTDEDKQKVENITNDEEAQKEMEKLFFLRTGKSVEQYLRQIRNIFSQGYIEGVENRKQSPTVSKT